MSATKKSKTYHYHAEWESDFFFIMIDQKCCCLICNSSVAIPKKGNIERHFRSFHENYNEDFPKGSELRKMKIISLKKELSFKQNMFSKLKNQPTMVTTASLKVCHLLAKAKKPFSDGELIKESFIAAAESLFSDFKNKNEILSNIKSLQLSRTTVMRRIEDLSSHVNNQLMSDIHNCVAFSLQFDESNDFTDIAQLMIFIRMVFKDYSSKEELLKIIPLHGRTTGGDIFAAFDNFVTESQLPLYKLISVTTDGAPAMVGRNLGFISFCKHSDKYPNFLTYHCIIHQLVLCSKRLNTADVMNSTFKIVNSIRGKALQRRLFKLKSDNDEEKELLLYNNVRWPSRSQFLERFLLLIDDVRNFVCQKGDHYSELSDKKWLLDLSFLVDFCKKLNDLNLELQGKNKNLIDMISSIRSFQ